MCADTVMQADLSISKDANSEDRHAPPRHIIHSLPDDIGANGCNHLMLIICPRGLPKWVQSALFVRLPTQTMPAAQLLAINWATV